jgi:transposase InsO family protein
LHRWVKQYREFGEAGLAAKRGGGGGARLPKVVKEQIAAVKQAHPWYGVRRIAAFVQQCLFLPSSAETVRRTLRGALEPKPKRQTKRNMVRPRFFERSTPNQLWQSDIFTFRLGGKYAYLMGFIDDYSRYMVGLKLYRSQTAEQVLEVSRRAAGEYKPPKEMLTDNGRQYANWRGTTKFMQEMAKDKIHHFRSRPHHPMTLGKIERFGSTIYQEFLVRAQFGSFEEARERIGAWVKYYNHQRPHQGIGGLFPASRYFEIAGELRKVIEQGIQDNLREIALRGKPPQPFYLVGRLDGQSVVLRAEKGRLRLSIDEDGVQKPQEIVYPLAEGTYNEGDNSGGKTESSSPVQRPGTQPGGADGLDGAAEARGEVCRELSIPWVVLDQWRQRALEGMLQALEPQVRLTDGISLSPRLQSLLEQQQQRLSETKVRQRLSHRLTKHGKEAIWTRRRSVRK